MKKTISNVSRIIPCSVNLLTVGTKTGCEAITATAMFISEDPPLFVVSVQKHIPAHDLIWKDQWIRFECRLCRSGQAG